MHLVHRIALVGSLLALTSLGPLMAIPRVSAQETVVGHVYINDNTAGMNTIGAFDRRADGSLVSMPGSPFAAGGAGTGTVIGSQGSLQLTSNGQDLLAVDAGSNQISVLSIASTGALTPIDLVSSHGIEPVSIAVHGTLVYIANAGNGSTGSNYTGFVLNPGGNLAVLSHSTVPLSGAAEPGDVLFSPDGSHLVGTEVGTSLIDSFVVGSDGRLTAAPGSPFPAQGLGPFGSEFRPTNSSQLFVSNAHNVGANGGTISAFRVATNGTLSSIGGLPFPDFQTAPCWIEISHDGQYLFTVNTASSSISSFSIAANASLHLLGSTVLKDPTGLRPFDAHLDPTGSFLYVVDAGLDAVSALKVSGGSLTELPSSPTAGATGATPFGIVVT